MSKVLTFYEFNNKKVEDILFIIEYFIYLKLHKYLEA